MLFFLFLVVTTLFWLVPAVIALSIMYWPLLTWLKFRRQKLNKKVTKQDKIWLLVFCLALYLLVGCYFAFNFLIFPNRFDPTYLAWLRSSPPSEYLMNILLWPFLLAQTWYLRYLDPVFLAILRQR